MDPKRRYDAVSDHDDDAGQLFLQPKRLKTFAASRYTLAWICALPLEMTAARMMLDDVHDEILHPCQDPNTYALGAIRRQNVVIACLPAMQYGTVKAAAVVTHLMRTFPKIRLALMVGIGGAAPSHANDIRLGDVVVGTRVMSYDLSKVVEGGVERTDLPKQLRMEAGTLVSSVRSRHDIDRGHNFVSILEERLRRYPEYGLPDLPDRLFQASYSHVTPEHASEYLAPPAAGNDIRIRTVSEYMPSVIHASSDSPEPRFIHARAVDCQLCDDSKIVRRIVRNSKAPQVHYGAIASGNQVVKSAVARDQHAKEFQVICFEMEAAGLMDLLPCIPIRGICDYSDTHKNKSWQKYASLTAASFTRDMIEHLPVDGSIEDAVSQPNDQTTTLGPNSSSAPGVEFASQQHQSLLKSLDFVQVRKFDIKVAHFKTCHWFLQRPEYQQWLDDYQMATHRGFLWIRGKPGVGKSTLMKFLYSQMREKDQYGSHLTITFFFHARGALLERSILGMYRSLLFQLLSAFPDLQAIFDDPDIAPRLQREWYQSLGILKSMLRLAVQRLAQRCVTCYIDALDECDEQQVVEMVRFFEDLAENATQQSIRLRVCFSSRHYPYIDLAAGLRLALEDLEGHTSDLSEYVLATLRIKDRALLNELRAQLLEKSSGVFLWIILVVEILNKENCRGRLALRKRLSEIPNGLMELFRDLIKRDTQNMQEFRLCVMWILSAARPLSPKEYYHAIWSGLAMEDLVDQEQPSVHAEDSEDCIAKCVISSSKGLVEIALGGYAVVQFIHESVRDFLIKNGGLYELWSDLGMDWESSSHELLKQCCSFYLAHTNDDARGVTHTRQRLLNDLPLLRYAEQNLLYHADHAAGAFPQEGFFASLDLDAWIRAHNAGKETIRRYKPQTNLIFILADQMCPQLIRQWLEINPTAAVLGDEYRTLNWYAHPFFAALASGHRDTVSALLGTRGTVAHDLDVNAILSRTRGFQGKMFQSRSPLTWAVQQALTGLVRWILESGISPDSPDGEQYTALFRAASRGILGAVELLLRHGADVNKQVHPHDETALLVAAEYGCVLTVRALLEHGAHVNHACTRGETALTRASQHDKVDVVITLLENHADVHHTDGDGRTSLILAARGGYTTSMGLLLDRYANIDHADQLGRTALFYAASSRHNLPVQLLIQRGAKINIKDTQGITPWMYALQCYRRETAEILAQHGAVIDLPLRAGYALLRALRDDAFDLARSLIDGGASLNVMDVHGFTPLSHACRKGELQICQLLLRKGALPDLSGSSTHSPLASLGLMRMRPNKNDPARRLAMARALVEHGADLNPTG